MTQASSNTRTVAHALYQHLVHLDLQKAEEAVEDARKIAWVQSFSGMDGSAAAALYARSPVADRIAAGLDGRSLQDVEAILHDLRFALYVNAYGVLEHTRFGALMKAMLERTAEEEAGRSPQ